MVLADNMDYVTGMSSVIATLMNVGPGFGTVTEPLPSVGQVT